MIDKPIPELGLEDLNRLYFEGEECDKRIFAEMRTNLQIVAGEHYIREGSKFWNRIRDNKQLTAEQRLKLTKNHSQRVTKIYRNQIESAAPGVACVPANENELSDQKSAQLHQSYWNYIKECTDFQSKKAIWIKNYVEIGEVAVKIFWDMNGGQVVGYEALMAPGEDGQMSPVTDAYGKVVQSDTPVYGGKINFETIEAYNLRRDPGAKSMAESPYLIYSKLLPKKSLRSFLKQDEDVKKFDNSPTSEYTVYDNNTNTYQVAAKDQVLVKEIYFRPGPAIPKGYFFIYTDNILVDQGELPYGIFPIVHEGFDEQTGNPRSHSVVRHIRPAQIEINRCASKIAEHQTTLGDDKAWIPANTKVTQGALLPGVRINTYSGVKPEITQGRSGEQYFEYLDKQISELYVLANVPDALEDQPDGADLYTNLLRSFRHRKKFAIYGQKFERFLVRVARTSLDIAKHSASEEELVPALGKSEYINMAEFKNSEDIHYQIHLEPRSDDIESQFGKQITLNHVIQYVGPNLQKEDIGKMLRLSPFLNKEKMLEGMTQKYDNAVNDILALDRGQWRPPRRYDDHTYILEALTSRMSKSDYDYLPEPVKQLYEQKVAIHEQAKAQELIEIQKAQAGFIPSGGYLVACDFYQGDPANPSKTKRVRVPSESLNWLIKRLSEQGMNLDELEKLPGGVLQEVGQKIQAEQQPNLMAAMLPQGEMNAQGSGQSG